MRDVIRNFNADGFGSLYPKYEGGHPPQDSSWSNRIAAQFTALRYFAPDGTDHASHKEQASMIRRHITWRNHHGYDERLGRIVDRASVA